MTERWRKMVEKAIRTSSLPDRLWLNDKEVVTLLARQHRAMVRKVRKVRKVGQVTTSQFGTSNEAMAWRTACAEILAALAKQGKGGR